MHDPQVIGVDEQLREEPTYGLGLLGWLRWTAAAGMVALLGQAERLVAAYADEPHPGRIRGVGWLRVERATLTLHPQPDGTVEIDTCQLRWHNPSDSLNRLLTGSAPPTPPAGPPPGRLVVAPAYTVAWQITDYQPCPPR